VSCWLQLQYSKIRAETSLSGGGSGSRAATAPDLPLKVSMTPNRAVARILLAHGGDARIIVRLQLQVVCATFRFAAQFRVT
jgi:hypothetical protein